MEDAIVHRRNTIGRCDCNRGLFWNGTVCSNLMGYGEQTCLYDYNCDSSKGLYCVNGTCTCKKPKIYNSTLNLCQYQFIGCYNQSNQPGSGSPILRYTKQTYRLVGFLEMCMDRCFYRGNIYALLATQNANLCCMCLDYQPPVPILMSYCNVQCFDMYSDVVPYRCGNTWNTITFTGVYIVG